MINQEKGYDRVWVNPSDMWMHWLNNSETLEIPAFRGFYGGLIEQAQLIGN